MDFSSELRIKFDEAWLLRINQKIDEALLAFAELKDLVQKGKDENFELELWILEGSLFRARGEIERSNAAFEDVKTRCMRTGASMPSRLLAERGLNAFVAQNYSAAFDDFLVVTSRMGYETNLILVAQATFNALLCTEHLGLNPNALEQKFTRLMKDIDLSLVPGMQSQWQAYEIRRLWSRGELNKIVLSSPKWNQATYHVHFLRSLPFINTEVLPEVDLGETLNTDPELYLRSYRIRTITGQHLVDDLNNPKMSEAAERIYLWVWQWLTSPNIHLEKIIHYVELLSNSLHELQLTKMDQEMLSLGLGWISLFAPQFSDLAKQVSGHFKNFTHSTSAPFLEFERLVQSAVAIRLASREDRDLFSILEHHPLYKSPNHKFSEVVEFLQTGNVNEGLSLTPLNEKIRSRMAEISDAQKCLISVDLSTMTIYNNLTGETLSSEPMAQALALLSQKPSVACSELVEKAFQQKGYDAYIHGPRIFNLLARIRSVLPNSLSVTKRADWVQRNGDWSIVNVQGGVRAPMSPLLNISTKTPKTATVKIEQIERLIDLGKQTFSRRDIEKTENISRASVNRLLRDWLREGVIESQGAGPARKYVLSEKWRTIKS